MNTQIKTYFATQSLPLGAALLSCGIELSSFNSIAGNKVTFIFLKTPKLDEIVDSFWKRLLKIEPILFWENQRLLKNRIYEGKPSEIG